MNKFYVYFLRRPDRDDSFEPGMACPFYVGKGRNGRKDQHRFEAKTLQHKPGKKSLKVNIIHKLWKQGLDFEEDVILDNLTEHESFEYEKEAIAAYGRISIGTGCLANLSAGGESGGFGIKQSEETIRKRIESVGFKERRRSWKLSMEARRNIADGRQKKYPNGFKHSKETCRRFSEIHKGKIVSEETRKRIAEAGKGRIPWNKGLKKEDHPAIMTSSERMKGNKLSLYITEEGRKIIAETASKTHKGKFVSEETRRKMSKAHKGKKMSEENRNKLSKIMKTFYADRKISAGV